MERPEFEVLDEVAADIESTREAWSRLGDFLTDRTLPNRDWISIRGKLYELDDFWPSGQSGYGRRRKRTAAGFTPRNHRGVQESRSCAQILPRRGMGEYALGATFPLLRFPTKGPEAVTRENLTLEHFLDRADLLIEKMDDLKTLHAQAQGEVTLREALHQLKVWGLDRRFSVIKHAIAGPRGGSVSLIKEWKDLFTEVAEP